MKSILMLALMLLLACTQSQQEETAAPPAADEKTQGVQSEEITYTAGETTLKGFLAYDNSTTDKRPAVLVVHEWWGHNDYTRQRALQLAKMGYTALAVDMYGDGKQAAHPEDAMKFATEVFQNLSNGEARFHAAMELLQQHHTVDPEKVAAIGYCFGGGIVLHMARTGADLDAVVSFHGSLDSFHKVESGDIKAQILVCNGAADPFVTAEQIAKFKQEMDDAEAKYQFVDYEGAVHGFTNPGADENGQKFNLPLAYNAQADSSSWSQMTALFNQVFSAGDSQ